VSRFEKIGRGEDSPCKAEENLGKAEEKIGKAEEKIGKAEEEISREKHFSGLFFLPPGLGNDFFGKAKEKFRQFFEEHRSTRAMCLSFSPNRG